MLTKLKFERRLQRLTVHVIRGQKIPSRAEFVDQRIGDRVRLHCGRFADAKDIPAALAACDLIGMPAGYDVQLALRGGHPRYRQRHRRVDVAGDEIDLIFVDQLASPLDSGHDLVRRISNQQLRFTAKNTAGMVDIVDREPGACDFAFGKRRINPGEGLDHADLRRLFAASANRKRRHNRARGACQAGFENGATANSMCVRRRCFRRFWAQVISSGPAGSKFSGPRLRRQGTPRYAPSSPGPGAKSSAGYESRGISFTTSIKAYSIHRFSDGLSQSLARNPGMP